MSQAKCNRLPKDVIDYNASLLLINTNFRIHETVTSSLSRNPILLEWPQIQGPSKGKTYSNIYKDKQAHT